MFTLTVFLQKSDGSPVDGVLSIYDTSGALVSRESSVDGVAKADLLFEGKGLLRVASDGFAFSTHEVSIDAAGEGELTLSALPVPVRTPIGPSWCSISGRFRSNTGELQKVSLQFSLMSGDYRAQDAIISNTSNVVSSEEGVLDTQLLRGRKYGVVFIESPYDGVCSYEICVPNREHADLYDVLYPYAVAGFVDQPFTGDGDYALTVLLSDGREIVTYSDLSRYIYAVEADNAEVTLVSSDQGKGVLRVSGQPGAVVRVTGNRRGDLTKGPPDTLQVPGTVFLSLVS